MTSTNLRTTTKHPRRPGIPPRADRTQAIGEDVMDLVATFASCRDLCTLGCVCRAFAPLPARDSLWELRALDILPSRARLDSAMSELHLTSYRQLVETFTRIGIPGGVLGFWQAEPPARSWAAAHVELSSRIMPQGVQRATAEDVGARGQLLRISLVAGGFLCESIAPDGTKDPIFTIRVSTTTKRRVKVGFFSTEKESSSTMGGDDWVPGLSMAEATHKYAVAVPGATERTPIRASGDNAFFLNRDNDGGRARRFTKLKAPSPPSPAVCVASSSSTSFSSLSSSAAAHGRDSMPAAAVAVAQNLCGLWCAPYGSHGFEIIQLSSDPSCATATGAAGLEERTSTTKRTGGGIRMPAVAKPGGGGTSSSSTGSESACTSQPATDCSSEASFSCSSEESDNSGTDDECEGKFSPSSSDVTQTRAAATSSSSLHRNGVDGFAGDLGFRGGVKKDSCSNGADHHHHATESCASRHTPHLFGVKVTGDANVPAGKLSFAIDMEKCCDIDAEIETDRRPVVLFLPSGAVMANLMNRRGEISFWRKGQGQINRVPGIWSPEWVDVDFVAYQPGSRCAFSVVFRQPAQAVRIIMDFERVLGSEEEWPQWPIATGLV